MKKIIQFLLAISFLFSFVNTYCYDNFGEFINSPNRDDLVNIVDNDIRYCEQIFLEAYMRREFTIEENEKCRNIFARKIEAEMNYKYQMLFEREIY